MTDSPLPAASAPDAEWQTLPPEARRVASLLAGLWGLAIGAVVSVPMALALDASLAARAGAAAAGLLGLPLLAVVWTGARWRRTRWRLDGRGLQVRRGLFLRREILVPRSRVQHLDLERGPIERQAGLATLVVHTAGTRMHALRQAGFRHADAVALRDALLPETDRDDDSL